MLLEHCPLNLAPCILSLVAVANNPNKLPAGYLFELTKEEKAELVENFHRVEKLKHATANPKVFTFPE